MMLDSGYSASARPARKSHVLIHVRRQYKSQRLHALNKTEIESVGRGNDGCEKSIFSHSFYDFKQA